MSWKERLESPFVLSLLVGLYPGLFYASNNWFMFDPRQGVLAFGSVLLFAFASLLAFYGFVRVVARLLVWMRRGVSEDVASDRSARLERALFGAACVGAFAYLMRRTLQELIGGPFWLWALAAAILAGLWIHHRRVERGELSGLGALGAGLSFLCGISLLTGLASFAIAARPGAVIQLEEADLASFEHVQLRERPNVYFIVPDAYPSQQSLDAVFGTDDGGLRDALQPLGFTPYDSVFSNYMHTVGSVSASFGMRHHLYWGNIGNLEILGARAFIVSDRNPVVYVFRRNGYRVSYIHQREYLFTTGCFVDRCSPTSAWLDAMHLLPESLRSIFARDRTVSSLEQRALAEIDAASDSETPQFVFIHFKAPDHSSRQEQTRAGLAQFRSTFGDRIRAANATLLTLVRRIVSRDRGALIIISGDHGAWGFGSTMWADREVLDSVSDSLIALDHLGVLLTIRWPNDERAHEGAIRSNINIFRYVLGYLSQDDTLLQDLSPDDEYLLRGQAGDRKVLRVVRDGAALEKAEEIRSEN